MAHPLSFLAGAGLGAGFMYFLDPIGGNRRRSLVRDQVIHSYSRVQKASDVVRRDASNRMRGLVAEIRSSTRHDEPSDVTLVERVRSRIGRCVSHPSAIEVAAQEGRITLKGPVLANELQNLVNNVRRVRGVRQVDPQLDVYSQPGNLSALQGGVTRYYQPFDLFQENWSPTTRVALGAAGLGLMATCLVNRTIGAMALGTLGFGLAACASANQHFTRGEPRSRSWRRPIEPGDEQEAHPQPIQMEGQQQAGYRQSQTRQPGEPAVHNL